MSTLIANSALKIEALEMTLAKAQAIENVLKDFLSELNYDDDRIDKLDCRRRDGFIPHSHNKGGFEANTFMQQDNADQWIHSFENAHATLEKYTAYAIEYFQKDNDLEDVSYENWTDEQREAFYEYQASDDQSDVLFSAALMLTSETELNIRLCVCVKDSPYHREYDDLIEFDLTFKNSRDLKAKLKKLLNKKQVSAFARAVREAY